MLLETVSALRDIPRLHEIATILIRYGWGDFVQRAGLASALERAGQMLNWQRNSAPPISPPERLRQTLEALGPTFIKLGQVLSTRVDMFTPEWIEQFERLQSGVPALPFEQLLPVLREALGAEPDSIFADINPEPLGAASIAQVHGATLKDGTSVVLKIRRPYIEAKIRADLRILRHLATLLESEAPELRRYQPIQIVAQFAKSLTRELDLAIEARNITRFGQNFQGHAYVDIPTVYWEYTRPMLNVQSRVEGIRGGDLAAIMAAGLDRKLLAKRGADAVLKMILIDGYFHADPHPGNVFYLPDNRLALIDFGMVGRLSKERRDQIVDLLAALSRRDEYGMLEVLLEWTDNEPVDEAKLANDLGEFVANYENLPLKNIQIGALLNDVTAIMRENQIILPADLTLLFKALISLEGLGRQLDPDFQLLPQLAPFVRQVIINRYKPHVLLNKGRHNLLSAFNLITGLPRDVGRLIKEIRRGRLKIDLDLKRLESFSYQIDKATNRLTMGVLTASLVIGSSIVMTVQAGPKMFGLPLFGLLGFLMALINSLWVIISIWRSGRH